MSRSGSINSANVELFKIGRGPLPDRLVEKLAIPPHIETKEHFLNPFVAPALIPENLDLVIIKDFNDFYQRVSRNPFTFLSECRGLYIAENHKWVTDQTFKKTQDALKHDYGLDVRKALLLPHERLNYWTIVHEGLHAVFDHLPSSATDTIIRSAVEVFDTLDKFSNMLDLTHLNITNFQWDDDELEKRMMKNQSEDRFLLVGFDDFYVFNNLSPIDQLHAVDEFISNFFANDRGRDRWSEKHLPLAFKKTLMAVGYNMTNPPTV